MDGEQMVTILCSGMGLGVYVPSLLLNHQLKQRGIKTEVLVIERYFRETKLAKLAENKKAFHESFKVAVLGHKMAKGEVLPNLDMELIEGLLNQWQREQRRDFIMMSGQWHQILERYIESVGIKNVNVDAVRMDAGVAPSWKQFDNNKDYFDEVWLYDKNLQDLPCRISVNTTKVVPFEQRQQRLFVHGGGWGMGTYQEKIDEIAKKGFRLDITAYHEQEIKVVQGSGNRYYLMDQEWSPWFNNSGEDCQFPPMYEVDDLGNKSTLTAEGYHPIFDEFTKCQGIISKPGGGTLLDSLESATPVIFLEPIAKHEKDNAVLWESLGLGISYDKWAAAGFSIEILEKIHNNLIEKKNHTPDYLEVFLAKYKLPQ